MKTEKVLYTRSLPASLQDLIKFIVQSGAIEKIVLFGSRARNQARENSDYDFAVWVNNKNRWTHLLAEIEEKNLTLLPVDLALYDELSSDYRKNIDQEGIVIYG